MHNNYFFLRQLSSRLAQIIGGAVISECFSQNKDELVIRFETHAEPFFIKANLEPALSCLSFPEKVERARKNSINLFPAIIGRRVKEITQFRNERSFTIALNDDFSLLFKMHGNRSNIILFQQEKPIELFKRTMSGDNEIQLSALHREIDWSFDAFNKNISELKSLYFTLGKLVWNYLHEHEFETKSPEQKWEMVRDVKSKLESPAAYLIVNHQDKPALSLLPIGEILRQESDPVKASNEFLYAVTHVFRFKDEKKRILDALKSKLINGNNYIKKIREKLAEVSERHDYKILADLIMANMHNVPSNAEKITVSNLFNDNNPIEIKLKRDLNAQKNAEVYYRKSKNQHIERENLISAIKTKQSENDEVTQTIKKVENATNLAELKGIVPPSATKKETESLPYHEFIESGFRIWVGKNAESNDVLTLKYAYKEDLWLHAKDVPGSHVIIKYQSGKVFPKPVIERAAQLAAYNSKRKTETLAPVIYTPKKYVRKRKGDPAGMVVVEKEKVIMVEPRL